VAGRHSRRNRRATSGAFAAQTQDIQAARIEAVDRRSGVLGDARRSDDLERIDGHTLGRRASPLSANTLPRWRDLLEGREVEVDWRAHLHPSARAPISTSAKGSANNCTAESDVTAISDVESGMSEKQTRRRFASEENLAIVRETERAGETVSSVARRRGVVAPVVFRWRAELGLGKNRSAKLAALKLADGRTGATSRPLVLHDLLQPPDGMTAVERRTVDGSSPRRAPIRTRCGDTSLNGSWRDDDRSGRREGASGAGLHRHEEGDGWAGDAFRAR
jgi:hypothetical protein